MRVVHDLDLFEQLERIDGMDPSSSTPATRALVGNALPALATSHLE